MCYQGEEDSHRTFILTVFYLICPGEHPECHKVAVSPRLLHYSASLHLVDMLPPPPLLPIEDAADAQSFTSDEG